MTSAAPRRQDLRTIERLSRLELRARSVVEGFLNGQHQSPYHGFAIEFAGHREYTPGDELKHIDWRVWSRTDRLYIKEYEEETNLRCWLVLDGSRSMEYGVQSNPAWSKLDHAATAAGALACLLHQQQDAVGLLSFGEQLGVPIPPSAHPAQLPRLFQHLEGLSAAGGSDLGEPFRRLSGQLRERSVVVLLSDLFVDLATLQQSLAQLRLRKHEVLVLHVLHADELEFPFDENVQFRGLESPVELQANPRALRKSYLEIFGRWLKSVQQTCRRQQVDYVRLATGAPLDAALSAYLRVRARSRRRG